MNKKEFFKELENKLSDTPTDERNRVLDYYSELYDEKFELGLREKEIIESFGSPDRIVSDVLSESVFSRQVQKVKRSTSSLFSKKSFLLVYFALFFVTIPLTFALLSLTLSAAAIILFGVLMVAVLGAVFTIAGPLYAGFGVYTMIATDAAAGLAQVGLGLAIFAAGLILFKLLKLLDYLRILIFIKKSKKPQAFTKARAHKKLRLGTSIAVIAAIIIGGSCLTGGFGMVGWDAKKLDTTVYAVYQAPEFEEFDTINIETKTRSVRLIRTDGEFDVKAYDFDGSKLTITIKDGVLSIKEDYKFTIHDIGNAFAMATDNRKVYIYVPEDIANNITTIKAEMTSGDLQINGLNVENVNIAATRANIMIEKSTIEKATIELTRGNIDIKTTTIINLKGTATNGHMQISLIGEKSEYTLIASTKNGRINFKPQQGTDLTKIVSLETTRGNINLAIKP